MKRLFIITFIILLTFNSFGSNDEALQKLTKFLKTSNGFYGIELLLAAPNKNNSEEKYGHAMIRFKSNGPWVNDNVLSFAIETNGKKVFQPAVFYNKYSVRIEFEKMDTFWNHYTIKKERTIIRNIIPTTIEQRESLKNILIDIINSKDKFGRYNLVTNNCLTIITKLLTQSNISLEDTNAIIPKYLQSWVDKNSISAMAPIESSNYKSLHNDIQKLLSLSKENYEMGLNWPKNAPSLIEEELYPSLSIYQRDMQIKRLLISHKRLPFEVFEKLIIERKRTYRNGLATYREVIGLIDIPKELYNICSNNQCARSHLELEKLHLESTYRKNMIHRFKQANKSYTRIKTPQLDYIKELSFVELRSYDVLKIKETRNKPCKKKTNSFYSRGDSLVVKLCNTKSRLISKPRTSNRIYTSIHLPFKKIGNSYFYKETLCVQEESKEFVFSKNCQLITSKNSFSNKYETNILIFNNFTKE